ncbi:MAG: HNH endonuclease signature motif containing protein [Nitrososphaeraceae archaeon]
MNGKTRKKLYKLISQRDGEYCKGCGKLALEGQLVVDHIDNDNSNNDPSNLQLLCRKCNYLKNPRRPVDLCERERKSEDIQTEVQISTIKKPQFNTYLAQRVNDKGFVEEKDFVYSVSKVLGISPITAKRWLDVECSSEGVYERHKIGSGFVIRYKSDYNLR